MLDRLDDRTRRTLARVCGAAGLTSLVLCGMSCFYTLKPPPDLLPLAVCVFALSSLFVGWAEPMILRALQGGNPVEGTALRNRLKSTLASLMLLSILFNLLSPSPRGMSRAEAEAKIRALMDQAIADQLQCEADLAFARRNWPGLSNFECRHAEVDLGPVSVALVER